MKLLFILTTTLLLACAHSTGPSVAPSGDAGVDAEDGASVICPTASCVVTVLLNDTQIEFTSTIVGVDSVLWDNGICYGGQCYCTEACIAAERCDVNTHSIDGVQSHVVGFCR